MPTLVVVLLLALFPKTGFLVRDKAPRSLATWIDVTASDGSVTASTLAELYAVGQNSEVLEGPIVWQHRSGLRIRRMH